MATQSMAPYLSNLAGILGQSGMQLWGPEAQRRRKKGKQEDATDDIANRLMTEEIRRMDGAIPRAEAVDPELEAEMRRAYPHLSTDAKPFEGGAEGAREILAIRNAADVAKQRDIENVLAAERFNMDSERHDQLYGTAAQFRAEQERAEAARKAQTQKQNELFRDTLAYTTNMRQAFSQLRNATNEDDYNAAADVVYSLYSAAVSRGLKVDPPQLQPFMSPEERAALEDRKMEIEELRDRLERGKNDWIPNWFGGDERREEELRRKEAELKMMPGYRQKEPSGTTIPRVSQQQAIAEARAAIAKGADPAAVAARLEQLGIDTSALQ